MKWGICWKSGQIKEQKVNAVEEHGVPNELKYPTRGNTALFMDGGSITTPQRVWQGLNRITVYEPCSHTSAMGECSFLNYLLG